MRYYCPQWSHIRMGWVDLPMLASTKKMSAIKSAKEFAFEHTVHARVVRKPKGWKPEDSKWNLPD